MQLKCKNSISIYKDKPKEHCAVFAVACDDISFSVSRYLYTGLISLQHRGQESTGISILKTGGSLFTYKRKGLVSKVLRNDKLSKIWGNIGIGHNRYATTGSEEFYSQEYIQPYHFKNNEIEFSFAFNGTIPNFEEIKEDMEERGHIFVTNTDTEVIAQLFASLALTNKEWKDILKKSASILDGSYSLVLLTSKGEIYAMRDPLGFRPLCIGQLLTKGRNLYFISSESCAIDTVGASFLRDIKPGEIIRIDYKKGFYSDAIIKSEKTAVCQFEYVYFARPDSVIDGISVAQARFRMGKNLAKNDPKLNDLEFRQNAIVVPVPDSGRSAAVGYANEASLPYIEGLMKNRYIWRTFIMPGQKKRKAAVKEKLNPIRSIVEGKHVILIDDSIVRGNTTKQIIGLIKNAGAASVNVRISCPPVISACYMGIDFPTTSELIAGRNLEKYGQTHYIEEIRKSIGADSLLYQTIEGLKEAIGLQSELCNACLTGKYPLKSGEKLIKLNLSSPMNRG